MSCEGKQVSCMRHDDKWYATCGIGGIACDIMTYGMPRVRHHDSLQSSRADCLNSHGQLVVQPGVGQQRNARCQIGLSTRPKVRPGPIVLGQPRLPLSVSL
mmetsp:Transcript_84516/g.123651  ORF Transcript_84516/g.123651 Transcript_84516/m.123651 type:complete len:101 (-) Transcript_84516:2070-2372(-)